ncbi:MAG TPA: biotin-dependent carboxyltransferase family protein [Mycobacteriales bacterium]|nr:biotin-dependent carboxyltransferase family protein [Mycobacteriales bacterium]
MTRSVTVLAPGPLCTVQDAGRPGLAATGVGRSGACDRASYRLANRLVGNPADAAVLEVTFGGLRLRADTDVVVVTTGARCPPAPAHNSPLELPAGRELTLGPPVAGLRTYVALRGGIDVPPVLGSRSTDLLSGLGPGAVRPGDVLPLGEPCLPMPGVDVAPVPEPTGDDLAVRVSPGPRWDWFTGAARDALLGSAYAVTGDSNRVGLRLAGRPLDRCENGELPSEGMARGALQVPPSGQPVLFLADHPVTGGYPVLAYVDDDDVDRCAQLRPGQRLLFRG